MPRAVMIVFVFAASLPDAVDALAQERASIVGVVSDSSGAVLPGVTVEASSAVLIERVRSGVTDRSGRYAIIDLRPGTYSVTFSLPGFKSYNRDGIVLEGAFAATVNASLSVGQVEETVMVTAASPVVDLQSTQNQSVINRQALDVLPAARTMQGGASLVPGVSFYSQGFTSNMSIHGSLRDDQHIYFDGMNIGQNLTQNGQQANGVSVNELAQQELVYDAGSQSAEVAVGGVRMDSIPREGGNSFSGIVRVFGGTGSLQNDNITNELRPYISRGKRARLHLRRERGVRRTDQAEHVVVPARAARVADQQPDSAADAVFLARRAVRVGRTGGAAFDGPADVAGVAAQQDRLGLLQIAGRHEALRRRLHGDQLQQRVVHFPRGGVLAADAAPVRVAGEVDVADHRTAAARGRRVAGGADLPVRLSAGSRPARHPACQRHHERADGGVEHGAAGLLQSDVEHRRQPVVRHRLAQHQDRHQQLQRLRAHEGDPQRRHGRAHLRQRERRPDAQLRHRDQLAVRTVREPEREPRRLRAGQMDVPARDAHLRRARRLLQCVDAGGKRFGRSLHGLGGSGRAREGRRCVVRTVLERLVSPVRRFLRSLRYGEDRAEDVNRQIPRPAGAGAGLVGESGRQPDGCARLDRSRSERNDPRRQRQRAVQRDRRVAQQQLRRAGHRHDAVRSESAAADQLGGDSLGAARADAERLDHRRLLPSRVPAPAVHKEHAGGPEHRLHAVHNHDPEERQPAGRRRPDDSRSRRGLESASVRSTRSTARSPASRSPAAAT